MKGNKTRACATLRARQAASFLAAMAITSAAAVMASMPAGASNTPLVTFSVSAATFDLSAG